LVDNYDFSQPLGKIKINIFLDENIHKMPIMLWIAPSVISYWSHWHCSQAYTTF